MEDDDLLPMSALEHIAYCPRQCALIHVDGLWAENAHTTAGRILHERPDSAERTTRPSVRITRSLVLRCERLGLRGVADVVEFHPAHDGGERPYPVEYKRGRRARWLGNEAQLCAQAMALEEMLGVPVPEGAIYHGASKRRSAVPIDARLRDETRRLADALRTMVRDRAMPPPTLDARCTDCSLRGRCVPEVDVRASSLRRALDEALR